MKNIFFSCQCILLMMTSLPYGILIFIGLGCQYMICSSLNTDKFLKSSLFQFSKSNLSLIIKAK